MSLVITQDHDLSSTIKTSLHHPLLTHALSTIKQSDHDHTLALLNILTKNILNGTVKWKKNVMYTINSTINAIDQIISKQLSVILHHKAFNALEGSWRGLNYLVSESNTSSSLKIKVLNISKNELSTDLEKTVAFDQSLLFKKIYEAEFGTPGGEPYGTLIGDYSFYHHPKDISMLRALSGVAAAAFCPFISSADPALFGFNKWEDLYTPRDLSRIFEASEYIKWNQFRETEDSRFIVLTLPRVLARLPYGRNTNPVTSFSFEEDVSTSINLLHTRSQSFCWMNAAYALGTKLTSAYADHGWCTAIRGMEGGGKVSNLPLYSFLSDDGDIDNQCPTEVAITDRREFEISMLGLLPLSHYKQTDYAVFFGAQTVQKPLQFNHYAATANAEISARLPYIMATSRFAHYLKVMARDKIGSFMEKEDIESWLNQWILQYVNANKQSKQDLKAKYPLAEAKVQVKESPGKPGAYFAIAWLRPWLQLEELSSSLRLVANIPELN